VTEPKAKRGRPLGSKNKSSLSIAARLREKGIDPLELLTQFATDKVPCTRCDENGTVPYMFAFLQRKRPGGRKGQAHAEDMHAQGERDVCPFCFGSTFTVIEPEVRFRASLRIADSTLPKLSSITLKSEKRRIKVLRMNSMTRMQQELAARLGDKADADRILEHESPIQDN